MALSRGWCFTINNYTEEDENFCYGLGWMSKYVVVGREIGESGTPHLQGYVYFENRRNLAGMKALHETAHWEPQKGTPKQAAEYCKKDGDFFEWGVAPMSQEEKGDCGREAAKERWALAKAGKFEELPPENLKIYEYIYFKNLVVEDRSELHNLWICGPSGCGKSRYVRDNFVSFYTKSMSKWWDGYAHEDVVVLDDFDPEHGKYLGYYLKIWADHYAFNAEVKGGMLKIRPKTLIVTSQYPLEACFPDRECIEAVRRRFQVVQLAPFSNDVCNLTKTEK